MASIETKDVRVHTRGEQVEFKVAFFEDEAKTIPIIPVNPAIYPSYSIYDTTGLIVQNGVGILDGNSGNYRTTWVVPKDAALSYNEKRWRIEWYCVSDTNRQQHIVFEFDVRDVVVTASQNREQQYITLSGEVFRQTYRTTVRPVTLTSKLFISGGDEGPSLYDGVFAGATGDTGDTGEIKEVVEGDSYVYYIDIPAGKVRGDMCPTYVLLWRVQETLTSSTEFEMQRIVPVRSQTMMMINSVRLLIDRLQKRLGRVTAYEDSDLVDYLNHGLHMINGWHPYTSYYPDFVPGVLRHYWVMAAGIYALWAQKILYGELHIDFSGQTTVLNYDPSAAIDQAVSNFMDYFKTNLTPTKMAIYRQTRPTGVMAGKPYRYTGLHQFTFKMSSYNSGSFVELLSKIGLL